MLKDIRPQWVLVSGQIHHVSDFPRYSSPAALCPSCGNPVILKLGDVRVHHYAHKTEEGCESTKRDNALHENTKFHIHRQLSTGTQLYLEQRCSNGCGNRQIVSWANYIERPEVERSIGSRRPDISILCSDGTSKAIEIKVTHAVEDEKAVDFENEKICWIEVEGSESIYDGENVWTIDKPLPFLKCKPQLPGWTCDNCKAKLINEERDRLREQQQAEHKKHNYEETIYAKLVDFYFPTNLKYREIYYLHKVVRMDKLVRVFVLNRKYEPVFEENGENIEELQESAFNAVEHAIKMKCKNGAIADGRMWSPWTSGSKFVAKDFDRNPYRYRVDEVLNKWVEREQERPNTEMSSEAQSTQEIVAPKEQEGVCNLCGKTTNRWYNFDKRRCIECIRAMHHKH
ncbi:MAG: competence protein CoiA family protein [Dehalococcoidales bacterium]|nr:competence protein CoiA family protein [Dehalococcoidales bacterium]